MNKKDTKKLFERYHARVAWEGLIKSAVIALIVGFSAMLAAALSTWICNFEGALWVSLVCGGGAFLIAVPIIYFCFFRPSSSEIAKRVDELGLEERVVTMLELMDDTSYIAMRQREDAKAGMKRVNARGIRYRISAAAIAVMAAVGLLSIAMTTVSSLAAGKVLPPVLGGGEEPPVYFTVSYAVVAYLGENEYAEDEGGIIEGEFDQIVEAGESATSVVAVADDGWFFLGWAEDGSTNPVRTDTNIEEDTVFTAVFAEAPDEGEGDEAEGDSGGEPGDSGESDPQQGESGGERNPNQGSSSGSGAYTDNDKIKDGETNYKDLYEEYYKKAMELLSEGEDLPPELREMLELYFGMLL